MAERHVKTPRQRAEEALGVAQRKVAKLEQRLTKAKAEVTEAEGELAAAKTRRDYLAADPALPQVDESKPDRDEGHAARVDTDPNDGPDTPGNT